MALGSISTWGALPDGMPLGSGYFPADLPQCPRNGLVIYRDFTARELERLKAVIESREYRSLVNTRSPKYYLAYTLARALEDEDAPWLLLRATWDIKNADPSDARANAYNNEFVILVRSLRVSAVSFNSIALQARAANALRELGRFEEAENLRRSVVVASDAGGAGEEAQQNREGWTKFLKLLAGPIARHDRSRSPMDMLDEKDRVFRCMAGEASPQERSETLTLADKEYCASAGMSKAVEQARRNALESNPEVEAAEASMDAAINAAQATKREK